MKPGKILLIACMLILMSMFAFAGPNYLASESKITANSDGTITAGLAILNTQSYTLAPMLIEVQFRSGSCASQFLSVVSSQKTCDSSMPQNVHKVVTGWAANEKQKIYIVSPKLPAGTYCVVGVSVDSCCNSNPNCKAYQPFGWQTKLGEVKIAASQGVTPSCGDHQCTGSENYGNCPGDCTAYCGDGFCSRDKGEDNNWCSDCGLVVSKCGDGTCDPAIGESTVSCDKDCKIIPGDGSGANTRSGDVSDGYSGDLSIGFTQKQLIILGCLAVIVVAIFFYMRKK